MDTGTERTVVLVSTRTAFEADAIAAALRERGVNARAIPGPQLPVGKQVDSRVMVVEEQEPAARHALEDIRSQSAEIDWDAVAEETGASDDNSSPTPSSERRLLMTTAILLLPIGFVVTSVGQSRGDPMIRLIGISLVATALTAGGYVLLNGRPNSPGSMDQ